MIHVLLSLVMLLSGCQYEDTVRYVYYSGCTKQIRYLDWDDFDKRDEFAMKKCKEAGTEYMDFDEERVRRCINNKYEYVVRVTCEKR